MELDGPALRAEVIFGRARLCVLAFAQKVELICILQIDVRRL